MGFEVYCWMSWPSFVTWMRGVGELVSLVLGWEKKCLAEVVRRWGLISDVEEG